MASPIIPTLDAQAKPPNPLELSSITHYGLQTSNLDIKGNVSPLYLAYDVSSKAYQVVDRHDGTRTYWRSLDIEIDKIRDIFYIGKRVLMLYRTPSNWSKAWCIGMLTPTAAEELLQSLSDKIDKQVVPVSAYVLLAFTMTHTPLTA